MARAHNLGEDADVIPRSVQTADNTQESPGLFDRGEEGMRFLASMALTIGLVVAGLLARAVVASAPESRFLLVSAADQAGQPLLGLQSADFTIENGDTPCDVIGVTPASYPLAIILDTSSHARTDFQALREAVRKFADALAPREAAIYTSGAPASRVEDFTPDRNRIVRAVASTFAAPGGTTHTLETILRVPKDVRRLNAPVAGVVVVSAGGIEMNPPDVHEVLSALLAGHTMLHVVELRTLRLERRGARAPRDESEVLEFLSARTRGKYMRGAGASVYASGLDAIRRQLDAESIVEYTVPAAAPHAARLRIRTSAAVLTAVPIDRAR